MRILTWEEIEGIKKKYIEYGNDPKSEILDMADLLVLNQVMYVPREEWTMNASLRSAVSNRFGKKGKKFQVVRVRELLNPKENGFLVQRVA